MVILWYYNGIIIGGKAGKNLHIKNAAERIEPANSTHEFNSKVPDIKMYSCNIENKESAFYEEFVNLAYQFP